MGSETQPSRPALGARLATVGAGVLSPNRMVSDLTDLPRKTGPLFRVVAIS
jgi:hypothetical protein